MENKNCQISIVKQPEQNGPATWWVCFSDSLDHNKDLLAVLPSEEAARQACAAAREALDNGVDLELITSAMMCATICAETCWPTDVFNLTERFLHAMVPIKELQEIEEHPKQPFMRAKMVVTAAVPRNDWAPPCEEIAFNTVCGKKPYGPNGENEDNTFALFTPSGNLTLNINNPALLGKLKPGQRYYLDFTEAAE